VIKVSHLIFENSAGSGAQIKAHIDQAVPCVEATMKANCDQPVMFVNKAPLVLGYEPFIQFAPKQWREMTDRLFQEMVDAWNEKHQSDKSKTK